MIVLGIDTSLRSTGYAVVEKRGNSFVALEYGNIKNKQSLMLSECLVRIRAQIGSMIDKHSPHAVAIEGTFFAKNAKTAMILGHARGTAIEVSSSKGMSVYEYAPRKVKLAVTGVGTAQKSQVQAMVGRFVGITGSIQEDAADAMAIAICHLNNSSGVAVFKTPQI